MLFWEVKFKDIQTVVDIALFLLLKLKQKKLAITHLFPLFFFLVMLKARKLINKESKRRKGKGILHK